MSRSIFYIVILLCCGKLFSQQIQLFEQINGRYDFTYVGNTLNLNENGLGFPCQILTSSSADLQLNNNDRIVRAYLYWAGSGTGDLEVKLNDTEIVAERTFAYTQQEYNLPFFSAFANVTNLVQNTGNGTYTFSDLDLSQTILNYCFNGTNFGGWAIIIVYENSNLPLNQLNIYDGLEAVPEEISITLNSLNVIDNIGAKIGFIAWEGDRNISVNETLTFNGNLLSNTPLNPLFNAFNGTNSITNSNVLYNMDLDVYNIQNFLNPGDQSAVIKLTSSQDLVMVNNIITKLNSQVPDASIVLNNLEMSCNNREFIADFSVTNYNSTEILPANVLVKIYANDLVLHQFYTENAITINELLTYSRTLTLPNDFPFTFTLKIVVDEGNLINEILETNNVFSQEITIPHSTNYPELPILETCNIGFKTGIYNLANIFPSNYMPIPNSYSIHLNEQDALNNSNEIFIGDYTAVGIENMLYVRFTNEMNCFSVFPLKLKLKNCPPEVFNAISNNNDGLNDTLIITGIKNIFENYTLEIYNRWGVKLWQGNHSDELWNGTTKNGNAPAGTYYYILNLNDPAYTKPINGNLYLTY